jgi:hypothetical protein
MIGVETHLFQMYFSEMFHLILKVKIRKAFFQCIP